MLTRRIIPCLDVVKGRVTKGVRFKNNVDMGDPVELARKYYDDGCDELVVYDITASAEGRGTDLEMVASVAAAVHIPFAVGGGVSSLEDMAAVLDAGAEKVSVNTLAVKKPEIIGQGARRFGSQCIVLGMDPVKTERGGAFPSGYEVTTHGFRVRSGLDAVEWAKRAEAEGVGEIVVNSVDADGTHKGFNLEITRMIADAVSVPVVASGGAGNPEHIRDAFTEGHADAAIVAGILHSGEYGVCEIKARLCEYGVPVRMCYA